MKQVFLTLFLFLFISLFTDVWAEQGIYHPKVKWKFKTQGPIRGAAVIAQDKIYLGSSDGFVYALHTQDGSLAWKYPSKGAITGSPTVAGWAGKCVDEKV